MPIVNLNEMIKKAHNGKYAIPHFNVNNLEQIRAVLQGAQLENSPVIVAVSRGAAKYMGSFKVAANLTKNLVQDLKITIPVAIHVDHGDYDDCMKGIEAGFTSVMFDGSALSFEENLKKSKEIREITLQKDISLEVEVGIIGGKEEHVEGGDGELADIEECKKMQEIKPNILAAGIGNIHGSYPETWKGLNFDRLDEIQEATRQTLPLVLHGGSGIPKEQVKKAISLGVAKLNIGTQLQIVGSDAISEYIKSDKFSQKSGKDVRKLNLPSIAAMEKFVAEMISFCGSKEKA